MVTEPSAERLALDAPPRIEPREGLGGLLVMGLPMLGSVGSIVVVSSMSGAGGRQYVAAGMFVLATLGFVVVQADRQRTQRRMRSGGSRAAYVRHLAVARARIRESRDAQRRDLERQHPEPSALPLLAEHGARLFERGPGHRYFLRIRAGVGAQPAGLEVVAPADATNAEPNPASAAALARLLALHRLVPDLPELVDLRANRRLEVSRSTARALVCSAAAFHSPRHLGIATSLRAEQDAEWDWLKWLPHLCAGQGRHELVVVDGADPPEERDGATLLHVVDDVNPLAEGPDGVSVDVAEALARRLARYGAGAADETAYSWGARTEAEHLRVAIGTTDDGAAVELDLKEAAQQGIGPHGLVVGATGSGKSELLRTLVLRLAMTHAPERLNLVLVDFKGGATFAGLADLPHVAALITNLVDDLSLVDRMHDALSGELVRRQELLRAAEVASVREHPDLPSLLVVVDEFAELLAAKPELLDLFVTVGRLGRSLGIHLVLASQRLDEGRLRGLESHLSYRIGLRTFSAQESRTVIGVPDAHELPRVPGLGFLRTDAQTLVRFAAAYVSGPVVRARARDGERVAPFTLADAQVEQEEVGEAFLDAAVRRMAGRASTAHRIWLPPLDRAPRLDELQVAAPLTIPVGVVDRPREQRRDLLALDLTGAGGHVAVVGGPRSGKSTLLRTIATSLARASSPRDLHLYLLDLGGGLTSIAELPNVVAHATRDDPDLVRRIVSEVGRRADDGHPRGEVFLLVDGWSALRTELDDLDVAVQQIASRGLGARVHVVLSASRWSDLRPSMRDLVGTRLELRLGDPADSEVDRRAAAQVPIGRPGRGLTADGFHFLAALPECEVSWPGIAGPKLPVLPSCVPIRLVDAPRGARPRLGLSERDLRPVTLDATEPHLLVVGDTGSGKTSLLRLLAHEIVRTRTPAEAQLLVVDPRRTLAGEVPDSHLLDASVEDAVAHLRGRGPGWTGPDLFVLVDDHDLVAPSLHGLLPLLPIARDVGLHLVVARRSGGIGRAMYDPLLQTLRDLGAPGVLLSGSPDEGPVLGGVRLSTASPGRGRLVSRAGVEVVQVAWLDPA